MDMGKVNEKIREFEEIILSKEKKPYEGELFTGVDLGTASIVLCVVDEKGSLVSGAFERCGVVRDGIVVDFVGACEIVRRLKKQVEEILGVSLDKASGAIPPGVTEGAEKIVKNVLEGAGFTVTAIVDEPTAAAEVLKVTEGAVVDIGGGTTGISILKKGEVTSTYDEATGGHHMNLVIAGSYGVSYESRGGDEAHEGEGRGYFQSGSSRHRQDGAHREAFHHRTGSGEGLSRGGRFRPQGI